MARTKLANGSGHLSSVTHAPEGGVEVDPGYVAVTLERLSMLGLKPKLVSE